MIVADNQNSNPLDVIASRLLDVDGRAVFHVRIGRPTPDIDGQSWRCHYEIDGPVTKHAGSFAGVDSVQALLNVLYICSVEAERSEEHLSGHLSWGGQNHHFGFPPPEADPERPVRP
jgi:hypothetical protein